MRGFFGKLGGLAGEAQRYPLLHQAILRSYQDRKVIRVKIVVVGLVVSLALLMVLKAAFAIPAVNQDRSAEELAKVDQLSAQVIKLYAAGIGLECSRIDSLISLCKFDEALPLAKQALELNEKVLGPIDESKDMCGGHVLLTRVSEEPAKRAIFEPVVVNGQTIRIIGYLLYRFERP